MDFGQLHERVRQELLRRIERGTVSVSLLARQTGVGQPHISNFLRRKRRLSLSVLDKILDAQRLKIENLFPRPREAPSGEEARTEMVSVVAHSVAIHDARVRLSSVLWGLALSRELLAGAEARCSPLRSQWDRFVAVQVGAEDARGMEPVVMAGAIVVLDRHYTSLLAVREGEANLYGVRTDFQVRVRYGQALPGQLLLWTNRANLQSERMELKHEDAAENLIVGRVVLVLNRF